MVLMIVSGRSGSGKSVALRALEDMGFTASITCRWYCCPSWHAPLQTDKSLPPSASTSVTCLNRQKSLNRR